MKYISAVLAVFALDIVAETKMPCFVTKFDFYTRVKIAIVAPVATASAIAAGCVAWSAVRPKKERKRKRFVDIHHAKHRGSHGSQLKEGLWDAAPAVLFFLDLVYPLVTRTLCSFFGCRDLRDDRIYRGNWGRGWGFCGGRCDDGCWVWSRGLSADCAAS